VNHPTKALSFAVLLGLGVPGFGQSNLVPQPLKPNEQVSGCCTYFCLVPLKDANDPEVFARDDASGEGLMRFEGKLHRLKLMSERQVPKQESKSSIGDVTYQTWSDGVIQVVVEYRITGFDEESYGFKGKVTVIRGTQKRTFPLWGASGC
jgi:hypothetical protein